MTKSNVNFTKDVLVGDVYDIGDYTYGLPKVFEWGEGAKLRIGKFCSIAEDVKIFLGGNHRTDWITTYPFMAIFNDWKEVENLKGHPSSKGDVVVGNDVWIGNGAVILSGVTIGDGAVIGASAVVTKDVNTYSIVVGNPAHEVKKRFSDEIINYLIKLQWWNWPLENIKKNAGLLCSDNIKGIIEL